MLFWYDVCLFEAQHECLVCPYHFRIFPAFHGLNQNSAAVNVDHDHDVFVARQGSCGELAGLVRVNGFTYVIYFGVDIALLLAPESLSVAYFKGCWLEFGGTYVLP